MTLQDFIKTNHDKLVSMAMSKVANRCTDTQPPASGTKHNTDVLLEQLRDALAAEARHAVAQAAGGPPTNPDIPRTAALHGRDLLALGFSVDEVVREYGDVCQAVTELALEQETSISVADFRMLNACLDNAIAAAVTRWSEERDAELANAPTGSLTDKKLRRLVSRSLAIFTMLREGRIGTGGSSAAMLGRHLEEMRDLLVERVADTAAAVAK